MTFFPFIFAAVVVGTWNGNWFPSGRAEHRAHPDVEAATSAAALSVARGQSPRDVDVTALRGQLKSDGVLLS